MVLLTFPYYTEIYEFPLPFVSPYSRGLSKVVKVLLSLSFTFLSLTELKLSSLTEVYGGFMDLSPSHCSLISYIDTTGFSSHKLP